MEGMFNFSLYKGSNNSPLLGVTTTEHVMSPGTMNVIPTKIIQVE